MNLKMTSGTAVLSQDGVYRYKLTRNWDAKLPELLVVMLNPSTADAANDDPTIRRVVRFAAAEGYGGIQVMNLFALRSTDPAQLWRRDAVGPENDHRLTDALEGARRAGDRALAAWGSSQWSRSRAPKVLALAPGVRWHCLGVTKDGSPRHPLYVPAAQQMVPFPAAGGAS